MDEERRLLIEAFENSKSLLEKVWHHVMADPKDAKVSDDIRKHGDTIFLEKHHDDKSHKTNFQIYCRSIAFAPVGSQELGLGYANRSAFLIHIEKYKECLEDVERAMNLTDSYKVKIKLLCRKILCIKNLKSAGYESAFAEAQNLIDNIDSGKDKDQFSRMLKNTVSKPVDDKVERIKKDETMDLPVTSNIFENLSVQYNKKYRRQLVAAKKYKPSDVIFVEKLYAVTIQPEDQYINCHHCMKICWSGVPCEKCNWAMFCSEGCYRECYDSYHDIECSLVSFLNSMNLQCPNSALGIKVVMKALKNAGGIANLKTELNNADETLGVCNKGFVKAGEFVADSIQSIYSLDSKILSEAEKTKVLEFALNILVGIVKHTKLMENLDNSTIESLMQEDLIFLGCLFIKITTVIMNNKFELSPFFGMEDAARGTLEESRGFGLAPLASLINHSCNPNAKVAFTENGKVIVFALHPIQKNYRIFISYCKEYYKAQLKDRQTILKNYNFVCSCQACIENWSPELLNLQIAQQKMNLFEDPDRTIFRTLEQTFLHSADPERKLMLSGSTIFQSTDNYCSKLVDKVENLSKKVIAASEATRKPSVVQSLFLEALYIGIVNLYKCLQPQSFGKCVKSKH